MTTFPMLSNSHCLHDLRAARPTLWINPLRDPAAPNDSAPSLADVLAAQARFARFAPILARLFPELQASGGRIESALLRTPGMQSALNLPREQGRLWVKADHSLPVAGSIKARGGIHEVLEFAESLALEHGMIKSDTDYTPLLEPSARAFFQRYRISVGSTGNLGLSIGVMASALGFRATVHMSSDAKPWKKARLRARGVEVIEHAGDYAEAVAAGRQEAQQDAYSYFVDDEHSLSLLLGYSAAALQLREQCQMAGIRVDAEHPLFVYLPCGVGGAPAGITLGLHYMYGPHVHAFFAEPTQSPCFLADRLSPGSSVYDFGLNNRSNADGLAVPRASALAGEIMSPRVTGAYTVEDDTLFENLYWLGETANMHIEPSAAAGFAGPAMLLQTEAGRGYLERHDLKQRLYDATHLVWTTGGLFVPTDIYAGFAERGGLIAKTRRE